MTDFSVFINTLSGLTGLDKSVVAAWVKMEQGVNNNVLGITSSSAKTTANPHGLLSFANQTAAAEATANLLKTSPNYKGIMASTGGTPAQQAMAIAQSPWHLGGAGLKAAGGTDPYYLAGFVKAGLLTGIAGAAPPSSSSSGSSSSSSDSLASQLVALVFGGQVGKKSWQQAAEDALSAGTITVPNYSLLSDSISKAGVNPSSTITSSDYTKVLTASASVQTGLQTLQNAIPDVQSALGFVGVIIVGIAFLGLGGLVLLKGKKQ